VHRTRAVLVGLLMALAVWSPVQAAAPEKVTATLDGRPIPVSEIAEHDCHDLEFPIIRCFTDASDRDASLSAGGSLRVAAAAAVTYVTVWDGGSFSGASISLSEDYDTLVTIGWNDRISSFKGRNSETGRFYVDWFHGGSLYNFCCNQQVASLGSLNNTFTSVYRT
jgi:WD40 repeat protein